MGSRHNVFLSYYHGQDQKYKDRFVLLMGDNIIDKSVNIADIIDNKQLTGQCSRESEKTTSLKYQ